MTGHMEAMMTKPHLLGCPPGAERRRKNFENLCASCTRMLLATYEANHFIRIRFSSGELRIC